MATPAQATVQPSRVRHGRRRTSGSAATSTSTSNAGRASAVAAVAAPRTANRPTPGATHARVAANAQTANAAAATGSLAGVWNRMPKPGYASSATAVTRAARGPNVSAVLVHRTTEAANSSAIITSRPQPPKRSSVPPITSGARGVRKSMAIGTTECHSHI